MGIAWMNTPGYDVQRPTGRCAITGQALEPDEVYIAALIEAPQPPESDTPSDKNTATDANTTAASAISVGLQRVDISLEAWEQGHRPDHLFSYWRSRVPQPNEKKKLFVDDGVLLDLFDRLADADTAEKLAFRFVLALILMRKRLLRYVGTQTRPIPSGPQQDWWQMKPKGADEKDIVEVLDPKMNDQQIMQVTEQVGQILEVDM